MVNESLLNLLAETLDWALDCLSEDEKMRKEPMYERGCDLRDELADVLGGF